MRATNCIIANGQPDDVARNQMVVVEWYTDELGNRARIIYNAKTIYDEPPYDLPRAVSLA